MNLFCRYLYDSLKCSNLKFPALLRFYDAIVKWTLHYFVRGGKMSLNKNNWDVNQYHGADCVRLCRLHCILQMYQCNSYCLLFWGGCGGKCVDRVITLAITVWNCLAPPSLDCKWLSDSLPAHCLDAPMLASLWRGY